MRLTFTLLLLGCLFCLPSCKEKTYTYEVNEVEVTQNNSDKDREKSIQQFIAILYANIYQEALSPDQLVDITELIASIGDKQIAYETILAKFITDPNIKIPTDAEMRADVGQFVENTYRRFYVREPSEAEKTYFVNYIESRPNVKPLLVYFAFATSDEYNYY